MFLLETFKVSFLFLLIFIGVVNIGRISNKLIFKKENYVETNIILGLISLSFLIGIALSLKIFDLYIIKVLIFVSYLSFFYFKKNFFIRLNKIDSLILYIILLFVFFSSLKNNFYTLDDINGYFHAIDNYISKYNIYSSDLRQRDYFSYPFYYAFNSLFISISNFYSATFFDIFFGSSIILFTSLRNLKYNKIFSSIALLVIFLSYITLLETNSPKILVIAILIVILFELEKFFKNESSLIYILILSSFLITLKFTSIASFTNILITVFLIKKIFDKKIKNIDIAKSILCFLILVLPWSIYSLQLFSTPLSEIFNSPYHYFENEYYQNLKIVFTHDANFFHFLITRQIFLTLFLFFIYFIFCKEDLFFKLSLFFSIIISYLFFAAIIFSDSSNFLRYIQPFFAANTLYLFIKIFNQINFEKINFKYLLIFITICIVSLRINQNVSVYIHHSVNNLRYLLKNNYEDYYKKAQKYFKVEEIYPKNYFSELNQLSAKIENSNLILLISRPYLFNFDKYPNNIIDYIEYGYGYTIVKNTYPLLENKDKKDGFFKERKIRYILIEKQYKKRGSLKLIKKNILKNNNLIKDIYGRQIRSYKDEFIYDDLIDYILIQSEKKLMEQTKNFELYKLVY